MKEEIAAAVVFLTRIVRQSNGVDKVTLEKFSSELTAVLLEKFKNHWYEQAPSKGQAYRCIRVTETEPVDPVLARVAKACNLNLRNLGLPAEFTLWIDPHDVTCRLGESMGTSYYTVASVQDDGRLNNQAHSLDVVEMVRSDHMRKSHELSRLQESARRRRHRSNQHTKPPTHKKYSFVPGRRVSPTEPYMDNGLSMNQGWYTGSPTHQAMPKDRFHWVRNDTEMVAA